MGDARKARDEYRRLRVSGMGADAASAAAMLLLKPKNKEKEAKEPKPSWRPADPPVCRP